MFAKKHLPDLVKQSQGFKDGNYEKALKEAFIRVDESLKTPEGRLELEGYSKAKSPAEKMEGINIANGVGCTACVALITPTEIYVANAGDSRSVLSVNKIAIGMSEDHKPDLQRESDRIAKAGGSVEEGRVQGSLNLSRSLGDLEYKQNAKLPPEEQMITAYPDVKKENMSDKTDFLVIACDGVWDCLNNEKAVLKIQTKLDANGGPKASKGKLGKMLGEVLHEIVATDLDNAGTASSSSP